MPKGHVATDTVILAALQDMGGVATWPADKARLAVKCGLAIKNISQFADRLVESGHVAIVDNELFITRLGRDFLAARAGGHGRVKNS